MKIIYGSENVNPINRPSAIAVGVFDGLHTGHKKIISSLMHLSGEKNLLPVLVTFDPHPDNILSKGRKTPMLCSLPHRLRLISELGIRACVVIRFDKNFAKKSCRIFINRILIEKLCMKSLVVGERFSFGKEPVSGINLLKGFAERMDFDITVVKAKRFGGRIISSSAIRSLIEKGNLPCASKLLGRTVSVLGTVIHGRKRGRILGFKTANIDPHHEAIPPSGVYAAYAQFNGRHYKSVVNIGRRPTFSINDPAIEVHMFGIEADMYDADIEVYFKKRLRAERKFKNEDSLRAQILKDAKRAKELLA